MRMIGIIDRLIMVIAKISKCDNNNNTSSNGIRLRMRYLVRSIMIAIMTFNPFFSGFLFFGHFAKEGIGITTNDGQTLDVEKSADFGFDRTIDSHHLASIMEGIESGGEGPPWQDTGMLVLSVMGLPTTAYWC